MRTSVSVLSRAAAVVFTAALALVAAPGTAGAASSLSCPDAASTRLVTASVLGQPLTETRLWVYEATSTQTIVCFQLPAVAGTGAIVINEPRAVGPAPLITLGSDPAACTIPLVDVSDPVALHVSLGAAGSTVCFSVNGAVTTVHLGLPSVTPPSIELWRDGGTWLDWGACLPVLATSGGNLGAFNACWNSPGRIL